MSDSEITVTPHPDGTFEVVVSDGATSTTHQIRVDRHVEGVDAEALVAASFRFLLDREPKESILGRFDLSVIGRYFPEYDARIGDYL